MDDGARQRFGRREPAEGPRELLGHGMDGCCTTASVVPQSTAFKMALHEGERMAAVWHWCT